MPIMRIVLAFLILLVVVGCVYELPALLDLEGARRWAFCLIDVVLVVACLFGACWLLRPERPQGGRSISTLVRTVFAILLLLLAGFCVLQAVAVGDVPDERRDYWLIDGTVGLASVVGACWLIWPRRPLAC
jgi:hypothetical protein